MSSLLTLEWRSLLETSRDSCTLTVYQLFPLHKIETIYNRAGRVSQGSPTLLFHLRFPLPATLPRISLGSSTGVAGEAFLLGFLHRKLEARPAPSSTVVVELDSAHCVNQQKSGGRDRSNIRGSFSRPEYYDHPTPDFNS